MLGIDSGGWTAGLNFQKISEMLAGSTEDGAFIYEAEVDYPSSATAPMLIFDGIKGGALVSVDGTVVLTTTNQFLSYNVSLADLFSSPPSSFTVQIKFDNAIETHGRYMACTGGWDWAPYTFQYDAHDRPLFTFGIVGPVTFKYARRGAKRARKPQGGALERSQHKEAGEREGLRGRERSESEEGALLRRKRASEGVVGGRPPEPPHGR
jgi:hypothetical protein